jgi:hypothetical protein
MINFASSFTIGKAHGLGWTRLSLSPRPLSCFENALTLGLYPTHKQQAKKFLGISVAIVIWNLCQVSKIFCSITDFPRWKVSTAGFSFQALLSSVNDFTEKIQYDSAIRCTSIDSTVLALLYELSRYERGKEGGQRTTCIQFRNMNHKEKDRPKSLSRRMAHSALLGFAIHCHQAAPQNREGPLELPCYSRSAYCRTSRHFIRYQRPSFAELTSFVSGPLHICSARLHSVVHVKCAILI